MQLFLDLFEQKFDVMLLKKIAKNIAYFGIDINYAFDRGYSAFGLNISRAKSIPTNRGYSALKYCTNLNPKKVLDVGSGGGEHAKAFAENGALVTCVDFGTSIYAKKAIDFKNVTTIYDDFEKWSSNEKYDVVWASHVLEHQRNVGVFLEKLIQSCAKKGNVVITLPFPHRHLWGGHLSIWSPGILCYNIVLCGIDLSDAIILYGYHEFSIIFSPIIVDLPDLSFDNGDLVRLKQFLPKGFGENTDSWC